MKRRRDGRTEAQLRPMLAEFGLLAACDGSARLTAGARSGNARLQRMPVAAPDASQHVVPCPGVLPACCR